ncbi:hypothetical protein ABT154_07515 [Streptomyces sp. NPDC001728]|uniref:hypothetical protein n=1 Tax=Streptomyces sp. NPDC001728 TaxID=3154396 RepID=UPI0033322DAD
MTRSNYGPPGPRTRTPRVVAAAAILGLLGSGLAGSLAHASGLADRPVAPTPRAGAPLLDETFTGATADSRFTAVGVACLTGAAPAPGGSGNHPLTGCPTPGTGPVPRRTAPPTAICG